MRRAPEIETNAWIYCPPDSEVVPHPDARLIMVTGEERGNKNFPPQMAGRVLHRLERQVRIAMYGRSIGVPGVRPTETLGEHPEQVEPNHGLHVADTGNHTIRKVTPAGEVTTVVGTFGKVGVQLGDLPASLDSPRDVAVRADGELPIVTANGVVVMQGF